MVRRLLAANDSIDGWETCLRLAIVRSQNRAAPPPAEANEILALLAKAKTDLIRRLDELGASGSSPSHAEVVPVPKGSATKSLYGLCVKASLACGRALGAAFREAQAIADIASAQILYGPLRAFEKQIWMLDPRRAD